MSRGEEEAKRWWLTRFSVRTLLTLVTLVAITLARVAYLRQMAQLHKEFAERFVGQICEYRQNPRDCVEYMTNCNASKDRAFKWHRAPPEHYPSQSNFHKQNGQIKVIWYNYESMDAWEMAVTHKVIAARYDRAVYRPWTRVSEVVE